VALIWHEIACRCLWWPCDENVWPCMKFVSYMLYVLLLIMFRSYAHARDFFCEKCFILIMAMSLSCISLSILLAMHVLKLWLFCLSMSHFKNVVVPFVYLFRGSLHSCIWELFIAWILVVLFCRWCWALLPHLEESTILEQLNLGCVEPLPLS
jgi:hypothetical protein